MDFLQFEGTKVELAGAFNLVKRQELGGPLPRLIRRTWELMSAFGRTRRRLRGLEMAERPEYPPITGAPPSEGLFCLRISEQSSILAASWHRPEEPA